KKLPASQCVQQGVLPRGAVDAVEVDDAAPGGGGVEVGSLQQPEEGPGQGRPGRVAVERCRRIAVGERHFQEVGQGPPQQNLAGPRRAEEEDCALILLCDPAAAAEGGGGERPASLFLLG